MKKILTLLLCAVMLPLLVACDEGDDILEIFTGKTWKLTYITMNGQTVDFWNGDEEAYNRSEQLRRQGATFTVTFHGSSSESVGGGEFEARAVNRTVNGRWSADGVSHELRLTDMRTTGSDTDVLAVAFYNGLYNVTRYEGDSRNLYIYYQEGETTRCMAFHIQ